MVKQEIDERAVTSADAATVHRLLLDGATWPTWSPIDGFELVSPAPDGTLGGLGEIRIFHTKTGMTTSHSREEVVEVVPDKRFSYSLLHGMPLRGYRADIDLTPTAEGLEIRWHSTFEPQRPGTGWIYRKALGRFIRQCVEGLATHAATVTPA